MAVRAHRGFLGLFLFVLAGWGAVPGMAEQPYRVRVIEGRAAVYASTNGTQGAVTWLPAGTEFAVRGELTEATWVRIDPPEGVSVWIYRELVRDGRVLADGSRIRSGAGLSFPPVAGLNKGDRVDVLGTYGDWLKIKPPPGVDFWVLRDQVEPLAVLPPEGVEVSLPETGAVAEVTEILVPTNAPAGVPEGSVTRVRPPVPPELSGFMLEEGEEQGVNVVLQGVLDWGGIGAVSAPFCLVVRQPDGETLPVCHLLAPVLPCGSHIGESVTVEGTRWRVKGSALPMLVPLQVRFGE
ncbi:MAG: SH3 domain-containing protein [Kiritimatiellae bacterium]|nr:SH3 domain-containing protein [Kiritimatiellia bacterium]